jgi:hypothetical protein
MLLNRLPSLGYKLLEEKMALEDALNVREMVALGKHVEEWEDKGKGHYFGTVEWCDPREVKHVWEVDLKYFVLEDSNEDEYQIMVRNPHFEGPKLGDYSGNSKKVQKFYDTVAEVIFAKTLEGKKVQEVGIVREYLASQTEPEKSRECTEEPVATT